MPHPCPALAMTVELHDVSAATWPEVRRLLSALDDLGIASPDDKNGVLQDVHWAAGLFGYFPTYALGNAISVQLWESALSASPGIPGDIEQGRMAPLLGWLRENVHRHGKKLTAPELVLRATGRPIEAEPYLRYLRAKYSELYKL